MVATSDYTAARINMVEGQIRPNKVTDPRIVDAFLEVPREAFVPKALRGVAYVDENIHVGDQRYLMEPMVLARLMQEARLGAQDMALVVGCGTGYAAAVAGRVAATVVAVEEHAEFAAQAGRTLQDKGVDNAIVMQGPLTAGWPSQAPYDVILLDGAVSEVPATLFDQLAEGGRLVAVVAPGAVGVATLFTKLAGTVSARPLFEAAVRRLPGFELRPSFQF